MYEPIRRGSDSEYPHVRLRDRHLAPLQTEFDPPPSNVNATPSPPTNLVFEPVLQRKGRMTTTSTVHDVIVIGSGPAGYTAATIAGNPPRHRRRRPIDALSDRPPRQPSRDPA